MSVYIKGMEMPANCHDCNCFIRDSDGSDYCCLLMRDIEDNYKRDDDCPLVPVPEHGRLIDADALITKVTDAAIKQPEIADVYYEQASEIGGWLYSMPTIIPADKEGEG